MEHITILILSGKKLCQHMWRHLYHVHCALHVRLTILDPNFRDVFYKTVAIEATAQHLVGNHPTSCLFPDSFLSLAILAGKKSLAGKIVTLLRHVRTLRKWDGIALITKCSCSTYFRMGTVTPTWWDLRPWRKSADLFATWRSLSWAARRVLLAEWRQRWLGVNNNLALGDNHFFKKMNNFLNE